MDSAGWWEQVGGPRVVVGGGGGVGGGRFMSALQEAPEHGFDLSEGSELQFPHL